MAQMGNMASMIIGAIGDGLRGTSNSWKNAMLKDSDKDGKITTKDAADFTPEVANEGVNWADQFKTSDSKNSSSGGVNISSIISGFKAAKAASDEDMKTAVDTSDVSDELLDEMSNVKPFHFYYKPEVQEIDTTGSVDTDPHIGVKAQDLEAQPLLNSVVSESDNGYKQIDIREMTLANTAAISALINKLKDLGVLNVNYK